MMRELTLALCVASAACSSRRGQPDSEPAPYAATSVVVENRDFKDYRISIVLDTGLEYRLGTIQGNQVQEFRIPDSYARAGGSVRFLAVPLASRDKPTTQNIVLMPGDQITIRISP